MIACSFVDIHTHCFSKDENLEIINVFAAEEVPNLSESKFYSVGLHPWHLQSKAKNDELFFHLTDLLNDNKCLAVGECGIDKLCKKELPEQVRVFKKQIELAESVQKPVIIHCVKAYNELYEIRKSTQCVSPFILHGYTGNIHTTQQLFSRNTYFSFGKILFNNRAKAIESFKMLPLEHIFLETDDDDITIEQVYKQAALLKNMELEAMKKSIEYNFYKIFFDR